MNSDEVRQSDFAGGEISPLAYGKTASPAYQRGLRTALNFIPTAEGPLLNRSGTRYVAAVNDSSYAPRLVAFSFADGQNFILEIGNLYLRVIQNGALVLSGGAPFFVVTPWVIADVMRLVFAQQGDVITVTHPSYQPREIQRITNTNWTVALVSYSPQAYFAGAPYIRYAGFSPAGGSAGIASLNKDWSSATTYAKGEFVLHQEIADGLGTPAGRHLYESTKDGNLNSVPLPGIANPDWFDWTVINAADQVAAQTYVFGDYGWSIRDTRSYISTADRNTTIPTGANATWVVASDDTRPPKIWQFVLTQVYQDALGVTRETLPSSPTPALNLALYIDRQASIQWGVESGGPASYVILGYNVYRGGNGIYGFVGNVSTGTRIFRDDGLPPDYGTQPPRGTNPFDIATGVGTKTQSWPGAFTYHEQRAVYARSNKKPQDFWGSAIGKDKNFDINTPVQDTDSFDFKPASERLEEIRSMLSLRYLLLFTSAGVWGAYGAQGGAMTATNITLRRYIQQGASYLAPLALERAAIFQTARGRVRDLNWDWRSDMYVGRDISVIARHLFEGHNIVDWEYAEVPYSLVWAVRDDGVLLSLTYEPSGIEGWAQHKTAGVFERVQAVVETDATTGVSEDAVYVVVRRFVNGAAVRYIERFSSRVLPQMRVIAADLTSTFTPDVRLSNFLDASLQFDGRNIASFDVLPGTQAPLVTLSGATYNGGDTLSLVAPSNFLPPSPILASPNYGKLRGLVPADIGSSVVIDPDGLAGGPYEAIITQVTDALHGQVMLSQNLPAAYQNTPVALAYGALTLNGLEHLNGMTVNALLDGAAAGPFVVGSGTVVLPKPTVIGQVGLAYNSDMELLDIASDKVKTNVKSVRKVTFEVVTSRGLLVGETLDDATKLKAPQLQVVAGGNTVPGLTTGNAEVVSLSSWNQQGRACLRQSDPLPCAITAVVREVVVGGR